MFVIVATILLSFLTFANGFPIVDCGSTYGSYTQIKIIGCDQTKSTCILRKGTNASMEINFTTNEDATTLQTVVHGTLIIIPIPFHVPNPNACTDPGSGITCPLNKGRSYQYKVTFPILRTYPSVSVTIKWELQDQNGNDIVCLKLPARLQ